MHKYWASKPWYVVKAYIEHFTEQGDIVLDPFCRSFITRNTNEINKCELMKFCFTSSVHLCSRLNTEGYGGRWSVNGYWVPEDWIEENVWLILEHKTFIKFLWRQIPFLISKACQN